MIEFFKRMFGRGLLTDSYKEYFEAMDEMQVSLNALAEKTYSFEKNRQELLRIIENLHVNEAVYKATIKLNMQEMLVVSTDGTILRTSSNLESLLGIKGDISDSCLNEVIKHTHGGTKCILTKLLENTCNIGTHGHVINDKSLRIRCSVLKDHNHNVLGSLLIIDDVTQRVEKLDTILSITKSKKISDYAIKLKGIIFKKGGYDNGGTECSGGTTKSTR